ncbi:MAG: N-acetylmuramoyl-L-alanine amidase [Bacteroidota bacterium]|uniref:N-acetylmuramoyl-L-alanine amidase n=1 Tax=Flagellimonas okinawensis TaxID=3031324 RepID=A0ABT5XN61_9FLAO|nr:N-acetylmuramoyl-L-alanine amidase [[Muricauda] okinawensis]MDF0707317.1 N-acetylmuramoyl-L-alanine amidase [[Muricauda] okinawensis]MEC8831094.1 N-acetylmuramoyl-L-alanine amidase [Bacteroidota bacterium]
MAQEGDGIYSLLRRHGVSPTKHYNSFVEMNAEDLGEDETLIMGRTYILPDTLSVEEVERVEGITYPIFGQEFKRVDKASDRLANTVYYLISGHGGPDPGAVEKYHGKLIAEDEYAYDVTLRLARELISHGAEVHLIVQDANDGIRDNKVLELDTDETVLSQTLPLGQLERLKQRTKAVNDLYLKNTGKYQRLLVTHVDSRGEGTNIDVFFYHHEKSSNGKKLAESIHRTFLKKYKKFQPNRLYNGTFMERSSLYVVKNTLPAMAYIEIGNIKNKRDQRRILDPDNRQALAKWISEGILYDYESSNTTISK